MVLGVFVVLSGCVFSGGFHATICDGSKAEPKVVQSDGKP